MSWEIALFSYIALDRWEELEIHRKEERRKSIEGSLTTSLFSRVSQSVAAGHYIPF